jgi:hypothetical protein
VQTHENFIVQFGASKVNSFFFPFTYQILIQLIIDLDPHSDTPVEILHTVLLGFVKYMWRDAVTRVGKKHSKLLATRLSSFDVSGLGLSALDGPTLVQYAGSLNGKDFRALAQVALHVLHGLVPDLCLSAWVALGALVPLLFQSQIDDFSSYAVSSYYTTYFLNHAKSFAFRERLF